MNPYRIIAKDILQGYYKGEGWIFEVDESRMGDDPRLTMITITDFIENGLTQGMNPFWKLTINIEDWNPVNNALTGL